MYAFLYATDPQLTASEVLRVFHSDEPYLFLGIAFTTTGILAVSCGSVAYRNAYMEEDATSIADAKFFGLRQHHFVGLYGEVAEEGQVGDAVVGIKLTHRTVERLEELSDFRHTFR